jgi:hypothetical protein
MAMNEAKGRPKTRPELALLQRLPQIINITAMDLEPGKQVASALIYKGLSLEGTHLNDKRETCQENT